LLLVQYGLFCGREEWTEACVYRGVSVPRPEPEFCVSRGTSYCDVPADAHMGKPLCHPLPQSMSPLPLAPSGPIGMRTGFLKKRTYVTSASVISILSTTRMNAYYGKGGHLLCVLPHHPYPPCRCLVSTGRKVLGAVGLSIASMAPTATSSDFRNSLDTLRQQTDKQSGFHMQGRCSAIERFSTSSSS